MYSFNYKRPVSLDEAAALMGEADDGKYLAGGQTLLPTMKQRLAMPSDLIDLGRLAELKGIELSDQAVTIGAGVTHAEVAAHDGVKRRLPGLASLAGHIGDPHVRHMGTLGGSICNNDPAADYPAALVALNATVHTTARTLAAEDFFTGMFETALEPGEIVTKVDFAVAEKSAYGKFSNPASGYAVAGVFVAKFADGVRVAVTGAGPVVFRVPEMEQALIRNFAPEAVADIKIPADGLNSDLHASAAYRAHLVTVMAKRAVAASP